MGEGGTWLSKARRGGFSLFGLSIALIAVMVVLGFGAPGADGQTDTARPSTPVAGSSTVVEDGAITVSWNASSDNIGVDHYWIRLRGVESRDAQLGADKRLTKFANLEPGAYWVWLNAVDAAGNYSYTRTYHFVVRTAEQNAAAAQGVRDIAAALERYGAANGSFRGLGGQNDQGYFAYSFGNGPKMNDTLIEQGFLDAKYADLRQADYSLYRCGVGDNQRAAIFVSQWPGTASVDAADEARWGCSTVAPHRFGHRHYVATRTIGELSGPEKLTTPVVTSASLLQDQVRFRWNPVPERAEYHWAVIYPDGGIVRGATTDTRHSITVDGQVGDHCIEVRAVLAGRDSDLSERGCVATPNRWSTPAWASGMSITDTKVSANFRVVPGAVRYQAQFRVDGVVVKHVTGSTASVGVFSLSTPLLDRAGEWCVRVRALVNGSIGSSRWSSLRCGTVESTQLATPVVSSPVVQGGDVVFSWAAVPERAEYHWAVIEPGGHTVRGATTATTHSVAHNNRGGSWCIEVIAVLAGRDSEVSERRCAAVAGITSLSKPVLNAPTGSDQEIGFSWRSVANAANYSVTVRRGNEAPTTSDTASLSVLAIRPDISDRICVDVVAIAGTIRSQSSSICRQGEVLGTITGGLANFAGTVRTPLAGVQVCAVRTFPTVDPTCTTSGNDGKFSLNNLRVGNYKVELHDPLSRYQPRCIGASGHPCSLNPIVGISSATPVHLSDHIHMEPRVLPPAPSVPSPPAPMPQPVPDLNPPYWTSLAWINTGTAYRAQGRPTWNMEVNWTGSWDKLGNNGVGEETNFGYGFEVWANGQLQDTTTARNYNVTDLPVGQNSTVSIRIVDQSGNKSRFLELRLTEPDWSQLYPSPETVSVTEQGSEIQVPAPPSNPNPTPVPQPSPGQPEPVVGISQPVGGITNVGQSVFTCPHILNLEHTDVFWNSVQVQFFNGSERPYPDGEYRFERLSPDGTRWERVDTVAAGANGTYLKLVAKDARAWVPERYRLVHSTTNDENAGQVCAEYLITAPQGVQPVSGEEVKVASTGKCPKWEDTFADDEVCVTYFDRYDTDNFLMAQDLATRQASIWNGGTASDILCTGLGIRFPLVSVLCLGGSLVGAEGKLESQNVLAQLRSEPNRYCLMESKPKPWHGSFELRSSDRRPATAGEDELATWQRINPICDAAHGPSGFPTSMPTWLHLTYCQTNLGAEIRDRNNVVIARCPSGGEQPPIIFEPDFE